MDCENSPRQACPFVLARQYGCSTRDRDAMDRSFLGAVGGAATEPRSGAGTAFLRRAPLGSNPGAGCCTARVPASSASTGQDGKTIGRVGERITPRGAPGGAVFKMRGVLQALRSLLKRGGPKNLFNHLGPKKPRDEKAFATPAAALPSGK